jgi:3-oxoadipate enol-lactonase
MAEVTTPLGRWWYEEHGEARLEGAAVVLLHSLLCDHTMWREQVASLAALGRVLSFDLPGHGRTEVPPRFTLEEHADALADALEDLGVRRAILVGLSWGAMISLRVALRRPALVSALALLDTSAEAETAYRRAEYAVLAALARHVGRTDWLVRSRIAPRMFAPETLRHREDLVDWLAATVRAAPMLGLDRALVAVASRTSVLERLPEITAPALVLCGREDQGTPPVHSQRLAAALAEARLEWIPRAGHLSCLEAPDAVNAALGPFVRERLSDPGGLRVARAD